MGLATLQQINQLNDKFDKLPSGYYYGKFTSVEDLPEATEKGYAYVASTDPTVFYIYLASGASAEWVDSGNKMVNTVDLTTPKTAGTELSKSEKYYVSANVADRATDIAPVTNEVRALGYKVLNPALSFAEQVTAANTVYEIRDEFDLDGDTVSLPNGCKLKFNGGAIKNGILSGELISDKPIDLREIGIVYNDATKASSNTMCLNLLSGITNKINLIQTADVWFGNINTTPLTISSISINGQGYTTTFDRFNGLKVDKFFEVVNLNVQTYSPNDIFDNDYRAELVEFAHTQTIKTCIIRDSKFTGNLRITTVKGASTYDFTPTFDFIEVKNNTFDNISFSNAPAVITFADSNYINLVVEGNVVHNFYGSFIYSPLTNGSQHETAVDTFYKDKGRMAVIKNNIVKCDYSWKPWTKFNAAGYYVFALLEKGDCVFENNDIRNLIDNNNSTSTHDCYLSVFNLEYRNNTIVDCLNLTGAYNSIFKSKSGGVTRRFYNNRVSTTNLSLVDDFNGIAIASQGFFYNSDSPNLKSLIFENNEFNFYYLYASAGNLMYAETIVFNNNIVNIDVARVKGFGLIIGNGMSSSQYFKVTNNIVNITNYSGPLVDTTVTPNVTQSCPALVKIETNTTNSRVQISNNNLKNCVPLYNREYCSGVVENNSSTFDVNQTIHDAYIVYRISENLVVKDNTISKSFDILDGICSILLSKGNQRIRHRIKDVRASGGANLVNIISNMIRGVSSTSYYSIKIKIYDNNSNNNYRILNEKDYAACLSEYILSLTLNNGTWTYSNTAYSTSDSIVHNDANLNASFYLYNFAYGGFAANTQSASKRLIMLPNRSASQMPYNSMNIYPGDDLTIDIEITKISSASRPSLIVVKGTSSERPTGTYIPASFSYFDTTLGKPIYWKGSAWVDGNGEAVGLQVSDTSVLIADSPKTVSVYYGGTTAPTITILNSDDSANTWLTATPDPFTGNTLTLTAAANNTSAPRGAKVLVSLGTELVIINVVQSY